MSHFLSPPLFTSTRFIQSLNHHSSATKRQNLTSMLTLSKSLLPHLRACSLLSISSHHPTPTASLPAHLAQSKRQTRTIQSPQSVKRAPSTRVTRACRSFSTLSHCTPPLTLSSKRLLQPCLSSYSTLLNLRLDAKSMSKVDDETCQNNQKGQDSDEKDKLDLHAWMLTLANENGMLSWFRNGFIATVAALGMAQSPAPHAVQAASAMFALALLNVATGGAIFMRYIFRLRRLAKLPLSKMLLYSVFALTQVSLFALAIGCFMAPPDL